LVGDKTDPFTGKPVDIQIMTIYCLYDDMLKAFHHRDDPQCQMTDAEVLTTALVAALFYGGNFKRHVTFCKLKAIFQRC
jgi:hypothetical protein